MAEQQNKGAPIALLLNTLATLYIKRGKPEKAVGPVRRSLALDSGQAAAGRLRSFLAALDAGG